MDSKGNSHTHKGKKRIRTRDETFNKYIIKRFTHDEDKHTHYFKETRADADSSNNMQI
uniref:Uncharacterized protein n=1 Tax=Solanum tuberosum TaxID=4113 RepID=M1AV50_SOLTU